MDKTFNQAMEDFIWNSNLIEAVWKKSQEKKIREQIVAYQDGERMLIDPNIVGHFKGWEYIKGVKRPITQQVLKLHEIMFTGCEMHNDCMPGMPRKINVWVGDRLCPEPHMAWALLKHWQTIELPPLERHIQFEKIHPFADGNGRSGRMLWAAETSIEEATILYENVQDYYKLFQTKKEK